MIVYTAALFGALHRLCSEPCAYGILIFLAAASHGFLWMLNFRYCKDLESTAFEIKGRSMDNSTPEGERKRLPPEVAKELIDMIESVEKEEAEQVGTSEDSQD